MTAAFCKTHTNTDENNDAEEGRVHITVAGAEENRDTEDADSANPSVEESLMGENQEADTDKKDEGTTSKWDLLHLGIMSVSSMVVDQMADGDDTMSISITSFISWIAIVIYFGIFLTKVCLKRGYCKCCSDDIEKERKSCSGRCNWSWLKVMVFVQKLVYTVYLILSMGLVTVMVSKPNQSEATPTPPVMVMVMTSNQSEAIQAPSNHSYSGGYSPGGQ